MIDSTSDSASTFCDIAIFIHAPEASFVLMVTMRKGCSVKCLAYPALLSETRNQLTCGNSISRQGDPASHYPSMTYTLMSVTIRVPIATSCERPSPCGYERPDLAVISQPSCVSYVTGRWQGMAQ